MKFLPTSVKDKSHNLNRKAIFGAKMKFLPTSVKDKSHNLNGKSISTHQCDEKTLFPSKVQFPPSNAVVTSVRAALVFPALIV